MRGRVQVAERGSDSPAWRVGRSTLNIKSTELLRNLIHPGASIHLTYGASSPTLVAGGQRTTRAKGEEVKKATKRQTFCGDCGVRLAESIYPPALSRRSRRDLPNGPLKPKKYVCHGCSVMQAWASIA